MSKNQRRVILINRRFQMRFALYVCSWLLAISIAYPILVYEMFNHFVRVAGLELPGIVSDDLNTLRIEVMIWLVLSQVVFLVATFLVSVFLSHRIAGPIYKMKQIINKGAKMDFADPIRLRKSDHFKDLAEAYNGMVANLREKLSLDAAQINEALRDIEKADQQSLKKARERLEQVRKHFSI